MQTRVSDGVRMSTWETWPPRMTACGLATCKWKACTTAPVLVGICSKKLKKKDKKKRKKVHGGVIIINDNLFIPKTTLMSTSVTYLYFLAP